MSTIIEVIHVLLCVAIIGLVLIQKSEGGGLGIGGGGGMSGFMTSRGQANLLTRTTAILFGCVILTSVVLAVIQTTSHGVQPTVLDQLPLSSGPAQAQESPPLPESAPAMPTNQPSVPLAK